MVGTAALSLVCRLALSLVCIFQLSAAVVLTTVFTLGRQWS